MRTTIDSGGRVVVPKPIRDRLGLTPGSAVEVIETGTGVLIESVEYGGRLEIAADGLPVIVSDNPVPITDDDIRAIIDSIRR